MAYWLLKTEPGDYSFFDLSREGTDIWDGVRAPLALKNLSLMKKGDRTFIYHTGKERSIVGTAEVMRDPYPDPKLDDPRYLVVEVSAGPPLAEPLPLQSLRKMWTPSDWELFRLPRLSVVPVTPDQWNIILDEKKRGV